MEYRQMEQRLKMDVPTLERPQIRDLFQESELFVRSFSGMSSFGLLSPLDLFRILTLISELTSHAVMLWTLTSRGTHGWLLLFSVFSTVFPLLLSPWTRNRDTGEETHDVKEARATAKQNRMRNLAHSDVHRPEIVLFGLGPWILQSWAKARRITLGLEQDRLGGDDSLYGSLFSQLNLTGVIDALQNVSRSDNADTRAALTYDYRFRSLLHYNRHTTLLARSRCIVVPCSHSSSLEDS